MRKPVAVLLPTILRGCVWLVAIGVVCWWVVDTTRAVMLPSPGPPDVAEVADGRGPIVRSIAMRTNGRDVDRVEADGSVTLVADAVSSRAINRLQFVWSVPAGELRGEGPIVTWRVPRDLPTPAELKSSLDVVEQSPDFRTGLTPEIREHRVRVDGPALQVNDSGAELARMAHTFLVERFGNSSVSPEVCVLDFSDACRGKADELADITLSRQLWSVRSAKAPLTRIEFGAAMRSAVITTRCTFHDVERATGREHFTEADCVLRAVYERPRWWLCESYTTNGSHRYLSRPKGSELLPEAEAR